MTDQVEHLPGRLDKGSLKTNVSNIVFQGLSGRSSVYQCHKTCLNRLDCLADGDG